MNKYLSSSLLNNLPVAVYSCDELGYITSFNKAVITLWGRTPAPEDKWCGAWKIFNPDGSSLDREACAMARTLKEGELTKGEEMIIERPDGTRRHVITHPVPLFDSENRLTGALNTLVDITEQKSHEEKQARLAAIIESSDDAIVSKSLNGIISSWNRAAEDMFGYRESEVIGKHISIIIPPSRIQEENVIIENIRKGNKVDHFETIRITKNGREIPISLTVSPIKNSHGHIIGASKIARDITPQYEAQKKMQLYNEQLKKINSYKDEFIGMASHELKTPLTSVNLYLQMLERTLTDKKSKRFAAQAVSQLNKLASLVNDLLDVSKIQAGKLLMRPSSFCLTDMISEAASMIESTISTHRIEIENHLPYQKTINADKDRLEQVIINLLNNAVKYSPKADKVVIKITETDGRVRIAVQDFGIGIAAEQHDKIFTRFYRIEELSPIYSGLGIGLYISYEIITRHGGKLWVESEPGKGATFFFEIPE